MRRLVVFTLLLPVGGCGAFDPAATRPTLSEAREICVDFDPDPAAFDSFVTLVRAFRSDGAIESIVLIEFIQLCTQLCNSVIPSDFCKTTCDRCTIAVVGATYR